VYALLLSFLDHAAVVFLKLFYVIGLALDLDETLDTSYIFLDIKSEFLMLYNIIIHVFLILNLYTVYLKANTVRIWMYTL